MSSTIESVLIENRVFAPPAAASQGAHIASMGQYDAMCKSAADDFEGYWAGLARTNLNWTKPFTKTLDESNVPFTNGLTMAS